MSKYNIGDTVFVEHGFDGILCKYKVIDRRFLDRIQLQQEMEYKYETKNESEIKNDPYLYKVKYDDDNICIDLDLLDIFETKYLLTSQIHCKAETIMAENINTI